jgi:hypothetical protein
MANEFADRVIEAPLPSTVRSPDELYRWLYDMWQRTGGFETYIINLNGLVASVQELNTLVGIDTNTTVQDQLNTKANTADIGTLAEQNANSVAITGGALSSVTITNSAVSGNLQVRVGVSATTSKVGASLHTEAADIPTTDNLEDNLMAYSLVSGALGNNGDYVEVEGWGTFAANANNKQVRLYFGSTVIFDTTALALNDGSWIIRAKIMREASADQKSIATVISSNTLLPASSQIMNPSEDDQAPILIKFTGQGVSAGDIIQSGFTVKWFAAST